MSTISSVAVGRHTLPIQKGHCILRVIDYSDVNRDYYKLVEGNVMFSALWRKGEFQVIFFNPAKTMNVVTLYLNEGQDCFKYWAQDLETLLKYLYNPDDYGEICEGDLTPAQDEAIQYILQNYNLVGEIQERIKQ